MTLREDILNEAKAIISQDRNVDYGEPEQNFEKIASLWSAFMYDQGIAFEPHEVAVLLMLVKVARVSKSPGIQDHWIDIAGYAACGGETVGKKD